MPKMCAILSFSLLIGRKTLFQSEILFVRAPDWLHLESVQNLDNGKINKLGFNGAETNCGIAHILGILLMNSCNTDKFLATTIICSLSALNLLQ